MLIHNFIITFFLLYKLNIMFLFLITYRIIILIIVTLSNLYHFNQFLHINVDFLYFKFT